MPAPLTRKNSLEENKIDLHDEYFLFKGKQYTYADVEKIRFFRQLFELRHIPVGTSDKTHAISIRLQLVQGEIIQITEQPTLLSSGKPENVEKIQEIYNLISAKSFQARVGRYLEQFSCYGYFDHCEWRIFPKSRKIVNTETGNNFLIDDVQFFRHYGFLEIRRRKENFFDAIKRKASAPVGVSTIENGDILFSLFAHFFDIRW